jgi:hypothetical protein
MMIETKWTLQLQISDGPRFNYTGSFFMEGLNRIDVVVPANSSRLVDVTSSEKGQVLLFFAARTDQPQAAEAEEGTDGDAEDMAQKRVLYYTIGDDDTRIYLSNNENDPAIPLTDVETPELHVVLGPGAIDLICNPPNELCFTNDGDEDAHITIIVCRETSRDCETEEEPETEEPETEEPEVEYPEKEYQDDDSPEQEPVDEEPEKYPEQGRSRGRRQQRGS